MEGQPPTWFSSHPRELEQISNEMDSFLDTFAEIRGKGADEEARKRLESYAAWSSATLRAALLFPIPGSTIGGMDAFTMPVEEQQEMILQAQEEAQRIFNNYLEKTQARKTPPKKKSKYRGVTWSARDSKWISRIWRDGGNHFLGSFTHEERAALAFDEASIKMKGVHAKKLNFPTVEDRERIRSTCPEASEALLSAALLHQREKMDAEKPSGRETSLSTEPAAGQDP
mmetsp:Transcript_11041/g.19490  ORF Transcript_11041/g.19490 Transcript_11041/m.19490 type:complete len:228 (+) Transcript_11041:71-754(+)